MSHDVINSEIWAKAGHSGGFHPPLSWGSYGIADEFSAALSSTAFHGFLGFLPGTASGRSCRFLKLPVDAHVGLLNWQCMQIS